MNDISRSLKHWGVLGMKWGRRKGDVSLNKTDATSTDHKRAQSLKKKRINEMSNDELQELVKRMNLEKQYRGVKKREIGPGEKFVAEILANQARLTINSFIASQGPKVIPLIKDCVMGQLKNSGLSNQKPSLYEIIKPLTK